MSYGYDFDFNFDFDFVHDFGIKTFYDILYSIYKYITDKFIPNINLILTVVISLIYKLFVKLSLFYHDLEIDIREKMKLISNDEWNMIINIIYFSFYLWLFIYTYYIMDCYNEALKDIDSLIILFEEKINNENFCIWEQIEKLDKNNIKKYNRIISRVRKLEINYD